MLTMQMVLFSRRLTIPVGPQGHRRHITATKPKIIGQYHRGGWKAPDRVYLRRFYNVVGDNGVSGVDGDLPVFTHFVHPNVLPHHELVA